MRYSYSITAALAAIGVSSAQETVLGAFLLSRHGDRTSKSNPPANLTDLGYEEIFTSGTYYRNRYVAAGAPKKIYGLSTDIAVQGQVIASAPVDNVLQSSGMGFLQGLYPPVGSLESSVLRNGTTVQAPLNGYQLIPLQTVQTGANSENAAWLQGSTNCANAQISSNNYFISSSYLADLNRSQPIYDSVKPMVNRTFTAAQTTFKNAYTIWDLLNVAEIHNASNNFPNANLLTPDLFQQLFYLANTHEFNLAYNASDPIRAVTGSIIAAEVVEALNATILAKSKTTQLNIQFGAYAGMLSFFGLANLTSVSPDFYGIPDYASSLVWELVTNATVNSTSYPTNDQIFVRFLFHNGTTSNTSQPQPYPLFGQSNTLLSWNDFTTGMNKFSINDQPSWCAACGNSTGVCSAAVLFPSSNSSSSSSSGSSNSNTSSSSGMSLAVAGVVGAMVTLAVILLIELAVLFMGGLRVVKKKTLAAARQGSATNRQSEMVGKA